MSRSRARLLDNVSALIVRNTHPVERVKAGGVFKAECFDQHGRLKWTLESKNIVVNVGLQYMAGSALTGTTQIPTWYLGLYGAAATNTPAAGDTMASHPGWNEFTGYSNATRPTAVFAPATLGVSSLVSNSASPAAFTINITDVVGGAFLTSSNVKGATAGTLFSAAPFASPGDRNVDSGDTLNVTYTFTLNDM